MSTISQHRSTRWDTPFGRWVHATSVSGIVEALAPDPELRVTKHAVYEWVAGRTAPTPAHGMALVRLSGGRLTLEAIYRQSRQVQRHTRPVAKPGNSRGWMQR